MKPMFKAPGIIRLKLKYDEPLSEFAFKSNLRRYTKGKGSKVWWKEQGYTVAGDAADTAAVTRKRRRLLGVGGGSGGKRTTSAMSRRPRRLLGTEEPSTATAKPVADGALDAFVGVEAAPAAPARRRLLALADTLSSGLGASLTAASGNTTDLSGVNASASSASASPAIDYEGAKVGRCRLNPDQTRVASKLMS
jgi:hypothetical protein